MKEIIEKGECNDYVMVKSCDDMFLENVKTGIRTNVNFYYLSSSDLYQNIPAFRTNLLTVVQEDERYSFRKAIRCFQIYNFKEKTFANFCEQTCFCTKFICPYVHSGDNIRNKILRFYTLFMKEQREWFRDSLTDEDYNWLKKELKVDRLT